MSASKDKILFLNLGWPSLVSKKTYKIHLRLPPLDLIYLHSLARQRGVESRILDAFVDVDAPVEQACRDARWIVATTTPFPMWQCPNSDWDWLKGSLQGLPREKLIISGLHGTVFPEKTLRETQAHALIRREPEIVFRSYLEQGEWRDAPGVSYLSGDDYHENPLASPLPPMNEIVATHYDVDMRHYGYFLLGNRTGIFESSRGCPWKCNFCDQEMHSWTYRKKSADIFAKEVREAVVATGMKTAYFYDLEFTIGHRHTMNMLEALQREGIPKMLDWTCQTRADMVSRETLAELRKTGCRLVHFGVESANPEILKATNKKITLDKIEEGVRLAKEAGLQTACFFMFGLPEETSDQFDNTLEFARRLNPTYASFHFAIPFPGTPLYERYITELGHGWGTWPQTYFREWENKNIARYLRTAYQKFYLFPKRIEAREFAYRLQNFPAKLRYFFSL